MRTAALNYLHFGVLLIIWLEIVCSCLSPQHRPYPLHVPGKALLLLQLHVSIWYLKLFSFQISSKRKGHPASGAGPECLPHCVDSTRGGPSCRLYPRVHPRWTDDLMAQNETPNLQTCLKNLEGTFHRGKRVHWFDPLLGASRCRDVQGLTSSNPAGMNSYKEEPLRPRSAH